jgi:hypothetical protein
MPGSGSPLGTPVISPVRAQVATLERTRSAISPM